MVQADDQDFDVNLMARDPNTLVDMEMVKVRPGQNDAFKSLQSKYRARARNSDNVADVFTFRTLQSVVDDIPEPFRQDSSDNELTLTIYRNAEARKVLNQLQSHFTIRRRILTECRPTPKTSHMLLLYMSTGDKPWVRT